MTDNKDGITVSALLVTRKNISGETEILNVLAHNKHKYGFPGGKLNEGETPEEAVIRETEEELGVKPLTITYRDTFAALTPEGRHLTMHVFTGEIPEKIAPTNEIAELHWLTYRQMEVSAHLLTPMTATHIMSLLKKL